MTKKSPSEKKFQQNSPLNLSKSKEKTKCIQPAILAIRTAALIERPPTPTPGASPSTYGGRAEPFLAPIYVPNKFMGSPKSLTHIPRHIHQPQNCSTTRVREINPIAKAESRDTYRHSRTDLAGLPVVDHVTLPNLSAEEVRIPRKTSFLPRIDHVPKQPLTGVKHGSFHALTPRDRQRFGLKRSPLSPLQGNSCGSDIKLPSTKSKTRSHIHKRVLHPQRTASNSQTPSPGQDGNTELAPKPPSLPKSQTEGKSSKQLRKHLKSKRKVELEAQENDFQNS
jgi:hypothetical protein